jgi:hypothetical protein
MNALSKLFFIALLISSYTLQAMNADEPNNIKIRGSAFIPQSERFREIYGKAAGNIELEYVRYLCEHISFWANIGGFVKHGHSIGLRNPTKIGIFNFSFGLDFPWEVGCYSILYLGLGPSFGRIHITNNSVCGTEKISKGAVGFVIKSGLNICLSECTFIEFFIDYIFEHAHFQNRVNVSGLRPGIGLGIKF